VLSKAGTIQVLILVDNHNERTFFHRLGDFNLVHRGTSNAPCTSNTFWNHESPCVPAMIGSSNQGVRVAAASSRGTCLSKEWRQRGGGGWEGDGNLGRS
jgi:hypothetical protein